MNQYWTPEKLGKHESLKGVASSLFNTYTFGTPAKILEKLKQSKFNFGNFGPVEWKDILTFANLDDCFKPEFIEEAMKVRTGQPEIGPGEFLLVSLFSNIGFAKNAGDLVDLNTHKKAEVKGENSCLSNGLTHNYTSMNHERLKNIFASFGKKAPPSGEFDERCASEMKAILGTNRQAIRNFFIAMQNVKREAVRLDYAEQAIDIYFRTKLLKRTIAILHLMQYANLERFDYLIGVNKKEFRCFNAPKTLNDAERILSKFEIGNWRNGFCGITIKMAN